MEIARERQGRLAKEIRSKFPLTGSGEKRQENADITAFLNLPPSRGDDVTLEHAQMRSEASDAILEAGKWDVLTSWSYGDRQEGKLPTGAQKGAGDRCDP